MKRKDIQELNMKLHTLGSLKGVKFAYFVAKNKSLLKDELAMLTESIKPSDEYMVFEKLRIALATEHSEKKPNKQPVMTPENNFKIIDEEAFAKEYEALKETHQEVLDARQAQLDEYNKILEEEVKLELYKVKQDDIPTDISADQMSVIIDLIEE